MPNLSYQSASYHNEKLKSLTRYRFDKVKERVKLKTSIARLMVILFSELEKFVPSLHIASVYAMMNEFPSTKAIANIPGINLRMGAMILAEIGDFNRFDSPDKMLAYARLSPSTYQSSPLESSYSHMERRSSRYLRYTLFNADKKLVRVIYQLEKTKQHFKIPASTFRPLPLSSGHSPNLP